MRRGIFFVIFIFFMGIFFMNVENVHAQNLESLVEIFISHGTSDTCQEITSENNKFIVTIYKKCFENDFKSVISNDGQEDNTQDQKDQHSQQNSSKQVSKAVEYLIGDIVISELVSSPVKGEKEWVELYNRSTQDINLAGWQLLEGSGNAVVLNGILAPGSYISFDRNSLNNKGDIVRLVSPEKKEIDSIFYGDWNGEQKPVALVTQSLIRKDILSVVSEFVVTDIITKDKENILSTPELNVFDDARTNTTKVGSMETEVSEIISISEVDEQKSIDDDDVIRNLEFQDDNLNTADEVLLPIVTEIPPAKSKIVGETVKPSINKKFRNVGLGDLRNLEEGVNVEVMGVVTVQPEVFGKGVLYIGDEASHDAVQVNYSRSSIPDVNVGDLIMIQGITGTRYKEFRIKLYDESSYKVISTHHQISPRLIDGGGVFSEAFEGQFVGFDGRLVEKDAKRFIFQVNQQEIVVHVLDSMFDHMKNYEIQALVHVNGIVRKTSTSYEVFPRSSSDITLVEDVHSKKQQDSHTVIGSINNNSKRGKPYLWLYGIVTCLVIFFFVRYYYQKVSQVFVDKFFVFKRIIQKKFRSRQEL